MSDKRFYITTAIDYTNGAPHLGHAYEKVLTDTIARMMRLKGREVFFLTGTDEHGQKVQMSAQKAGVAPIELCDKCAGVFQNELLPVLNITNDDFVRTTQERHIKVVQQILQEVYDKGLIYKASTTGFYSVRQEQFLMDKDRREDGSFGPEWGQVIEMKEENYYFKQSQFQPWLVDYLEAHPEFIYPAYRMAQVKEFLKEPLNDLCISRPKSRLEWGIELPFDKDFVTFVWFDALINYISVIGYGTDKLHELWPVDYHVIGKDIMCPPHAVYWPIMLHAIGLEPPKTLLVHGWWNAAGGEKMSKSIGNVIDPIQMAKKYGADAFRYYVIREMQLGYDSEFTQDRFDARYNGELANDLGNLVSRLVNMTGRYCGGAVPAIEVEEASETELKAAWKSTRDEALAEFDKLGLNKALELINAFTKKLNAYLEQKQPWKLAKSDDAADKARVATCLATVAEGVRLAAAILTPVIPQTSAKIMSALGLPEVTRWTGQLDWGTMLAGKTMSNPGILFPKFDQPEVAKK